MQAPRVLSRPQGGNRRPEGAEEQKRIMPRVLQRRVDQHTSKASGTQIQIPGSKALGVRPSSHGQAQHPGKSQGAKIAQRPAPGGGGKAFVPNARGPPRIVKPAANPSMAPLPNRAIRLVSKRYTFNADEFMGVLRDQNDFTVIGVLGFEGSGKSTILSMFSPSRKPFNIRKPGMEAKHCTEGIDAFVTPERLILLDSQPVLSSSVFTSMILENAPCPPSISLSTLFEFQSLQLVLFMMSVCHVIIVAADAADSHRPLWRLLQAAEMLRGTLTPGVCFRARRGVKGTGIENPGAEVVFAFSNLDVNRVSPKFMQTFQKNLDDYFQSSMFRRNGAISNYNNSHEFVYLPRPSSAHRSCDSRVNVYCFPFEDKPSFYNQENSTPHEFVSQVCAMPKPQMHQRMSERAWLKTAAKLWDEINSSRQIGEYRRMLQKVDLVDGTGSIQTKSPHSEGSLSKQADAHEKKEALEQERDAGTRDDN